MFYIFSLTKDKDYLLHVRATVNINNCQYK